MPRLLVPPLYGFVRIALIEDPWILGFFSPLNLPLQ